MSARHLPLLLLALVAALAAGLWLVTHRGKSSERNRLALRPSIELEPDGEVTAPADLAELPEVSDSTATTAQSSGVTEPRRVASTEYGDELARAWSVEGRVAFPAGTPPDERVMVIAKGKKFEHGPLQAVAVNPDGSFRVSFSENTKLGQLELEARYLYLDRPVNVAPGDAAEVVLEPRLGGVLAGRVVPPPDRFGAARELASTEVDLSARRRAGALSGGVDRSVGLDSALAFEFTALPAGTDYTLSFDPLIYEESQRLDLQVEAGAETVIDLPVLIGVGVSGRVVDGAGAPVEGAAVELLSESGGSGGSIWRAATTSSDGAFAVKGLSPGSVTLDIEAKGFVSLELELGRLERGAERAGLELKLARGSSISGTVMWSGGVPAPGATVAATPMGKANGFETRSGFKTDAEGRFTITGLEPGPHQLSALARREETILRTSRLLGREVESTVRTPVRASLSGVEAGTGDVVLELDPGMHLGGVVVDDLGRPVDAFTVACEPAHKARGSAASRAPAVLSRTESFLDAGGAFTLTGLVPGDYRLTVRATGHLPSSVIRVAVPAEGALPPVRLTRAAHIAGVVFTPEGERAPCAAIQATGDEVGRSRLSGSFRTLEGERVRSAGAADGDGRFDVYVDPQAGSVKLRACLPGWRSSELLVLATQPGAALEGVTLRLRPGAILTGVLLGRDGKGLPGRTVEVGPARGLVTSSTETDPAGRFEVPGLEPGSYNAVALPSEAEVAALGNEHADLARDLLRVSAKVEVAEGGGHVVLATPVERPVRVFGTITASGRPARATLMIQLKGGSSGFGVQADAEGAYEILLPRPGAYALTVQLAESTAFVDVSAAVEGPTEERLDLDVPIGSIAGRVHGPDGPVGGAKLVLKLERLWDGSEGNGSATVEAGKDGRYDVQLLPAGTWAVSASDKDLGRAKVEGIAVAGGQHLSDVDLHLAPAPARGR